jgi:hypothetical protein
MQTTVCTAHAMLAHASTPLHALQTTALTSSETGIMSVDDDGAENLWSLPKRDANVSAPFSAPMHVVIDP